MNTKSKISVDAEALKQVLAALVGPGHLIRELQVIRGLPALGGVSHDPIGTLIAQFNEFENAEIATAPTSEAGKSLNDITANVKTPPMPGVTAPRPEDEVQNTSGAPEKSPWRDIALDPPADRMRVILASEDFVYGDCFHGRGSVTAGMASNPGYLAERANATWRYSANEDPLPKHFAPTKWQSLPEAPSAFRQSIAATTAPRKFRP